VSCGHEVLVIVCVAGDDDGVRPGQTPKAL
jgi:hypothetical protein